MNTAEVLRAARKRIEDPGHWCASGYAFDSRGLPCDIPWKAERVCAAGAVLAIGHVPLDEEQRYSDFPPLAVLREAAREQGSYVALINDRGHGEALALLDRAIELAESL